MSGKICKNMAVWLSVLAFLPSTGIEAIAGPPTPVPYKFIPDPPDDAERHIIVKSDDRGEVWLLTGFLNVGLEGLELMKALKPRHWRGSSWPFWVSPSVVNKESWGDAGDSPVLISQVLERILEFRKTGMSWQVTVDRKGPYTDKNHIGKGELKDFYEYVYTLVKYCRLMRVPIDYWEVTNEPPILNSDKPETRGYQDHPGYAFVGMEEEFFAMWDTSYDAIRAAYPEAKIAGPSYGVCDVVVIEDFLAHCKAKGQKLDVLSWHEISQYYKDDQGGDIVVRPDMAHKNIMDTRRLVETKYPELGIEEIHIDEWGGKPRDMGPGNNIAMLYYLGLAGVDRAVKTYGHVGLLSDLLADRETPRHSYWAWKAYADGVGKRLVTETNDRGVVAIASRNDSTGIVRAVLGRSRRHSGKQRDKRLPPVRTRINFEGLSLSGKAEVTILRLGPDDGPLLEKDLGSRTTKKIMAVTDGQLALVFDKVQEEEAYSVTIAPVGTLGKEETAKGGKPSD